VYDNNYGFETQDFNKQFNPSRSSSERCCYRNSLRAETTWNYYTFPQTFPNGKYMENGLENK